MPQLARIKQADEHQGETSGLLKAIVKQNDGNKSTAELKALIKVADQNNEEIKASGDKIVNSVKDTTNAIKSLKNDNSDVVEAIRSIPEVQLDLSTVGEIKELLESKKEISLVGIEKLLTVISDKKEVDFDLSLLKTTNSTLDKIKELLKKPEVEYNEDKDYTQFLVDINNALFKLDNNNDENFKSLIQKIDDKYLLGRSAGGAYETVFLKGADGAQINPATSEKQDEIIEILTDGSQIVTDYWTELKIGNVPGKARTAVGGGNPGVQTGVTENFWSQGGLLTYLTEDTQLYVSSTSSSDVGQILVAGGVDEDYNPVNAIVITNGQNQAPLSALMYRVEFLANISAAGGDNIGDLYLAESDTLTAGVPDTTSKIKIKMLAGNNLEQVASYSCPAGKQAYIHQVSGSVGKSKDATVSFRARQFGSVWARAFPFEIFQASFNFFSKAGFSITEKTDLDFVVNTRDTDTPTFVGFEVTEIDL